MAREKERLKELELNLANYENRIRRYEVDSDNYNHFLKEIKNFHRLIDQAKNRLATAISRLNKEIEKEEKVLTLLQKGFDKRKTNRQYLLVTKLKNRLRKLQ